MNLHKARTDLFDTTFVLGRFRQNAALKQLAASPETGALDILVSALEQGVRAGKIQAILLTREDQPAIDHLWRIWSAGRSQGLASVLSRKGAPSRNPALLELSHLKLGKITNLAQDRAGMRRVFALFTDPDPDVKRNLLTYAEGLPATEESADELYGVWLHHDADSLAQIIRRQGRRPSNPALDALFLLLDSRVEEYLALENERGELFQEAYIMAAEAQRLRLNDVVLQSGNRRLADAYEVAMSGRDDFSSDLVIKAKKTAEDDQGLFAATRYMTLPGLLDLCGRWAANGWRPAPARERDLVERAVAACARAGDVETAVDVSTPAGTQDLFDCWRGEQHSDQDLLAGLGHADPFVRMRSLYLGGLRNILPAGRLDQAAKSPDWPERMVVRLLQPSDTAGQDHVHWVNGTAGGGELLTAPVDCTPEDLEHFGQILYRIPEQASGFAGRYRALTQVLHAFQSIHAVGRIVVEDDDGAREQGDIQVGEMADAPADVDFSR